MQITYPDYYKKFSCTADKCKDTCCAGWGIVIDDNTLKKYRRVKGAFGKRLRQEIDWREKSFCQNAGRCAFLNHQNLCDIYTELGEQAFCDTCRRYPRHIEEFENLREISLSLSCPEVAEIILSCQEKVRFLTKEKKGAEETYEEFDFFLFDKLMDARSFILEVLQNRDYSIEHRIGIVLGFTHDLQRRIRNQEIFQIDELIEKYQTKGALERMQRELESYRESTREKILLMDEMMEALNRLEVLNQQFPAWVQESRRILYERGNIWYQSQMQFFREKVPEYRIILEQLMVYFVFTYFCGAVYDENAYTKMKMAVISTLFLREWMMAVWIKKGKQLEFSEIVELSYRYSRELEHSDLNLNTMEEMLGKDSLFSMKNLFTVLMN
ncbi:flagellin lysine-N-methylase [Roseburia sp. 499]|uniref:flagellin lysine-N-methylase n=1 Tax=Roseburia sp. 499 TaxID=1261634 RepID=UPI000951C77A|nr:flagellin lysine-N-methylase [Roseburia sp. 499]WVK70463.1 flagellin lysine-N-methylase [Roseburia sp. 499]